MNPALARMVVELFELRFDPAGSVEAETERSRVAAIEAALENVDNLNEDRVLRQYLALYSDGAHELLAARQIGGQAADAVVQDRFGEGARPP